MTSLPNADILEVDPNQVGKSVAVNTALAALDAMLGGSLSIDASMHATPYVIPYTSPDEPLGTKTALRFFFVTVTGALSGDWTAYFPASKSKFFAVLNNTSGGHNVVVKVSGQTGVTVPAASQAFCFLNGTDVIGLSLVSAGPGGSSITMRRVTSGSSDSVLSLTSRGTQITWESNSGAAKSQGIPDPTLYDGYDLDVMDIFGDSGTNPITVTPGGTGTITQAGLGPQSTLSLASNYGNLSLRAIAALNTWIVR